MEHPLIQDRERQPGPVDPSARRNGIAWWPKNAVSTARIKSTRELRTFALVVSGPLLLIGGYLLWKNRTSGIVILGLAGLLLGLALVAPGTLAPVERVWMKVAGWMSIVMTFVILTLTFFLVITPVGWMVRLFGQSGITFRPDPARTTYWEPVETDGPATRPDKPY